MNLSKIGLMVVQQGLKTFEMRPAMNLSMQQYVLMPNHFHAIIGIGDKPYNTCRGTDNGNDDGNRTPKNIIGPQSKNLSSIVG